MSAPDREQELVRVQAVRAYVESAEQDLRLAEIALATRDYTGWGQIGFHAQQAVEKLLKALLISHHVHPDPVHDIADLRGQLRLWDRELADDLQEADSLNLYAVRYRYPPKDLTRPHPLNRQRVKNAVATAQRTRDRVLMRLVRRGHLPE
ncbi:MAG: HEPN domain-containing protein [Gemmatimonadetes bacterium]|nr:HEPN domain-containing protein [Gemmatimonadota bacterium]